MSLVPFVKSVCSTASTLAPAVVQTTTHFLKSRCHYATSSSPSPSHSLVLNCSNRLCMRPLSQSITTTTSLPPPSLDPPNDHDTSTSGSVSFTKTCWKCPSVRDEDDLFFCHACGVIKPPPCLHGDRKDDKDSDDGDEEKKSTFFDLFGFPVSFDIDLELLKQRHRALALKLHPDRFTKRTDQEREFAYLQTAIVNHGNQTLRNPVLRARYILSLAGISTDDEFGQKIDPMLLGDILEAQEDVEDSDADGVASMRDRAKDEISKCCGQLKVMFGSGSHISAGALPETLKLMMWDKVYHRAKERLCELGYDAECETVIL